MTRIAMTKPEDATGPSAEILNQVRETFGGVPNVFQVLATSPAALGAYAGMSQSLEEGSLAARLREMIAVAVAARNGCEYCLAAHAAGAKAQGVTNEEMQAATAFEAQEPREQAALTFVREAISQAGAVDEKALEAVRDAGWSDEELLEMLAHIALNQLTNMVNRLAETPNDMPKHALKIKGEKDDDIPEN